MGKIQKQINKICFELLPRPTLFYGNSANKEGKINYIIGSDNDFKKLVSNGLVNTLVLSENNLKNIKVNFKKADSIPIYGFNFDDGKEFM